MDGKILKPTTWGLSFVSLLFGLSGCQTPTQSSLAEVQLGMEKSEVLEKAGNPRYTARKGSTDYWTYVFYVDGQERRQEIRLFDGRVVSVGAPLSTRAATRAEEDSVTQDYENLVREKEHGQSKP